MKPSLSFLVCLTSASGETGSLNSYIPQQALRCHSYLMVYNKLMKFSPVLSPQRWPILNTTGMLCVALIRNFTLCSAKVEGLMWRVMMEAEQGRQKNWWARTASNPGLYSLTLKMCFISKQSCFWDVRILLPFPYSPFKDMVFRKHSLVLLKTRIFPYFSFHDSAH